MRIAPCNLTLLRRDHESLQELLGGFYHAACFDAAGADGHLLHGAIFHGTNALKVGVEATLVNVMSVAHVVPYHRLFAAYFTHLGHVEHSFFHVDGFVKTAGRPDIHSARHKWFTGSFLRTRQCWSGDVKK